MKGVTFAEDLFEEDAANHQNAGGENNSNNGPTKPNKAQCPNCGSTEIEQHSASGASICTECGVVVEENAIVSSVEFAEGAGGTSSMVGQFVSATSSKAYSGGGGRAGGRHGFSRDSRESTLANGRRRIQEVASRMRLGNHFVDAAHRFYTIAVEKNFVKGRKSPHVTAACLYIACRQERSQHMLIDFSDALQVNVYTLGTCFLKFRRLLGLKLEVIDPALYVYRFAAHLDLDEKANAVSLTALRVVGRMKRDWMVAGRRPAGICAAALLIASRAHGFKTDKADVTKVLRVCGMTVTNRLREFEHTPSASLTLEQFTNVDLDHEADPPVYTKNKRIEARAQAIMENNVELLHSGALDDPSEGGRATKWREDGTTFSLGKKQEMSNAYESIEADLKGKADPKASFREKISTSRELVTVKETHVASSIIEYPRKYGHSLVVLPSQATEEELQKSVQPPEAKFNLMEWKQGLSESSVDEIDLLFRDDDEIEKKEEMFDRVNQDYLEQQRRKKAIAEDLKKEDGSSGVRKYKKRQEPGEGSEYPTTEEALLAAVATRKISRKINYDAMTSIFDDQGTFTTDMLEDRDLSAANYDFQV